jgi:dihydrofolate reductase
LLYKDVPAEIRWLKQGPGKNIIMLGSNTLCVSLMQERLVDEFQIMVNPVAIGKGTSLFTGLAKQLSLKLADTRNFKSGAVLLTYRPR